MTNQYENMKEWMWYLGGSAMKYSMLLLGASAVMKDLTNPDFVTITAAGIGAGFGEALRRIPATLRDTSRGNVSLLEKLS